MGHEVISSPLLEIVQNESITIPNRPWAALLVTSANGVRNLPEPAVSRDLRVIAVGAQSAQAARDCGFHKVESRGGDVTRLAEWIAIHLAPTSGPLLYVTGKEISGDLAGSLSDKGFEVRRVETYQARPRPLALSKHDIATCNGVLLYSPRSAKLWMNAMTARHFESEAVQLKYYCLSPAVADQLPQSWLKLVASEPTESALLQRLEPAAKGE
jgi:uroporphyrinogen-III synthase